MTATLAFPAALPAARGRHRRPAAPSRAAQVLTPANITTAILFFTFAVVLMYGSVHMLRPRHPAPACAAWHDCGARQLGEFGKAKR